MGITDRSAQSQECARMAALPTLAPPWRPRYMSAMRLYQFSYSPYAAKVRKCLELKGLAYDVVEVPYLDRRELLEVSGGIMIPVLVEGGEVIADSARITAWLDERHAPSLRPGALVGAATAVEAWADNVLEDVAFRLAAPAIEPRMAAREGGRSDAPALFRLVKERRFGVGALDQWRAEAPILGARLAALLAPWARTLTQQPFLLGERPTVADTAVWGQLFMIEDALPGRVHELAPGMSDWYRRVAAAHGPRAARG
jgi:glutathione S-transferase